LKRELIGSALAHAGLLVVLLLVTTPNASLPPPVSPDDVMMISPVDALPAGMAEIPAAEAPSHAQDIEVSEPAEVAIPEPEAIPIEPKPAPSEPKPKPKPVRKPVVEQPKPAQAEAPKPADGVYESRVQSGQGAAAGGSLLGLKSGVSGGRPASYPDRITNKIFYMWHNPVKLPDSVSCSVVFRVGADGHATQIALENSSGMPAYDNSTVRAIYEAAPYPPFPRSMKEDYIVMRIIFEYVP
jgi:protein TonB